MELHGRDGQNVAINRDHTDHCYCQGARETMGCGQASQAHCCHTDKPPDNHIG